MMNYPMYTACAAWAEKLAATHPDDLSPSDRAALDMHIASCPACATVRAEYQAIDTLILDSSGVEPLPGLPIRLLQSRKKLAHLNGSFALVPMSSLAALTIGETAAGAVDNIVGEFTDEARGRLQGPTPRYTTLAPTDTEVSGGRYPAGNQASANPPSSSEPPTLRADASALATQPTATKFENPAHLIIRGPNGNILQDYLLEKPNVVIGRATESDIHFPRDLLVSRTHATIHYEKGHYVLRDEGSANGTLVNNQSLARMVNQTLQDGDAILIGDHQLTFKALAPIPPDIEKIIESPTDTDAISPTISVDMELSSPVPAPSGLPGTMSLSELTDRCMSEINNYRRGEPSSDKYCLEIFRRAMLEHDNAAWTLLVERFHEYMLGSFRRHVSREAASLLDSPENYVARAFERFWLAAVHNQQLEFTTLAAALSYLRNCLNGAILDTLRAYSRSKGVTLPEPGFAESPAVEDHEEGQEMWDIIQNLCSNERERRVAYLLFRCNLKPREIVRRCPQDFNDVQEIYRLRRTIMERIMRDSDQIRWKTIDEQ